MRRQFDRATTWIVDRPLITLAVIVSITGLAVLGHRDPDFFRRLITTAERETDSPREPRSASRGNASQVETPDVEAFSLTDADAVLVVESQSFFSPTGAKALRYVVEQLEAQEYVRHVLWMDRVPILNIFGLPEPLFPRSQASEQQFEAAREKALQHPLVKGQMLSADGNTLLLLIHMDWAFVRDDEDCTVNLKRVAQEAAAEFPSVQFEFGVTGRAPITIVAMQQHEANQLRYQLIGYGVVLGMAMILFRGLAAVIIVAIAPTLGVIWTLGILRFFDVQGNPFNDVVLPVLLSLVGFTDGVHLMVQIRRHRASGMSVKEAARHGVREVGLACALTSLTTAIGFASLLLAHHEVVREFGFCCVIGVILTFVAVLTAIPLASSTRLARRVHAGYEASVIDKNLSRISGLIDFVLRRSTALSILGVTATLACVFVSLSLRPDERNANVLPERSEPLLALRKMDRALGGLEVGRVEVRWHPDVSSTSPEVITVISEVDELLTQEELIGHPISIRNLLDALPGEGPASERMSLLELLPPPLKRAFYRPEELYGEVMFRVQDLGIAKYGPVFQRIEAGLSELQAKHPSFDLELSGAAVWRWRNLYQIVVDLSMSLGSAAVVIFFVMTLAYRSIRIGLISLIPNLFPLAVTGVYLVVTGQALEVVNVCAFTICLGIAVDDSIHFLTRFQEELRETSDKDAAIRRAFTGVGTALIMTTVVLVAGFSTVIFSGLREHRIFASMGILTISFALIADLTFLPALLSRFAKRSDDGSSVARRAD